MGICLFLFIFLARSRACLLPHTVSIQKLLFQYNGRSISDFDSIINEQTKLKEKNPDLYSKAVTTNTYDPETKRYVSKTERIPTKLGYGQEYFINYLQCLQFNDSGNHKRLLIDQAELEKSPSGSYQARLLEKEIANLKSLPVMRVTFAADVNFHPLMGLSDDDDRFIEMMAIASFLIIFLAGSVYSREYQTNLNDLLLTSRNGKHKVPAAKAIAVALFSIIIAAIVQIIQLAVYFRHYYADWNASANSMEFQCYYNISLTVGQMFLVLLGLNILGCVALGLTVLLISSVSRSSIFPIMCGIALWFLPLLYNVPISDPLLKARLEWLKSCSIMGAQHPPILKLWFNQYLNFFGYPVSQFAVAGIFSAALIVITGIFAPKLFRLRNTEWKKGVERKFVLCH